jgi:hypothetical protein
VQKVDLADIAFVTVPTAPWELDPNRLVLDDEPAEALFEALREDRSLTGPEPDATAAPGGPATPAPGGSTAPVPGGGAPAEQPSAEPEVPAFDAAAVPLLVANGTDDPDRAAELQKILRSEGYALANTVQSAPAESTQIVYGPGYEAAAAALVTRFGVAEVQLLPSAAVNGIELIVGADFVSGARVAAEALDGGLDGQTAEQATCQAASGF